MLEIVLAGTSDDLEHLRTLMRGLAEHFSALGHGPVAPDAFFDEIEGPDALYSQPEGRMLIAREDGRPVGCAMMRRLDDLSCEVRRVFVVSEARRRGVARAMMQRMIVEAREAGYQRMRLVTGAGFATAIALYESLGFRRIPPYRPTTWEDVTCMEMDLG